MKNIIKSISRIIIVATMITTNIFVEENILAEDDRFETAITISKSWKTSQEAILVNSTATSDLLCATVLSSQIDCPILLTNKNKINESAINEIKRLNVNKLYLIGGEDVINASIEKELNRDSIKTERISGENRYETNAKVIENFYKESTINKIFYCKGKDLNKKDEIIDGMLVTSIASKEKF